MRHTFYREAHPWTDELRWRAFVRVRIRTPRFFIARYQSLASYKAVVERLTTFRSAIDEARALGTKPPRIELTEHSGRHWCRDLVLSLPDGREIVQVDRLMIEAGTTTLVSGPSGSGKSTLFRAISGIWPYGRGTIDRPADAKVMLLPQRPYVPSGTLKTAVAYPSVAGAYRDKAVRDALEPPVSHRLPAKSIARRTGPSAFRAASSSVCYSAGDPR